MKSVAFLVSEMTIEQLKKLRTDYEEVDKSRKEAEEQLQKVQPITFTRHSLFPPQCQSQLGGLQRQSAILMTEAADDAKLLDALMQVEGLQKDLDTQKTSYNAKVGENRQSCHCNIRVILD